MCIPLQHRHRMSKKLVIQAIYVTHQRPFVINFTKIRTVQLGTTAIFYYIREIIQLQKQWMHTYRFVLRGLFACQPGHGYKITYRLTAISVFPARKTHAPIHPVSRFQTPMSLDLGLTGHLYSDNPANIIFKQSEKSLYVSTSLSLLSSYL